MTTNNTTAPEWEKMRTPESQKIEELLRNHFAQADAYRYNSASLRVRIIDPQFQGLSRERRDDLVDPVLSQLEESIQADIMNVVLMYPDEDKQSFRVYINNTEFEHPSQSML